MSKKRKTKHYRLIFICLALSILSWFAVKISKNYTQTYQFDVEFINLPKNKFLISQSDKVISVMVNAKGISLLQFEFSKKEIPIDYSLIVTTEHQQRNQVTIKKEQLNSYLINQLDFPAYSKIVEPLAITLEFETFPK
jgi:hypothetical protein